MDMRNEEFAPNTFLYLANMMFLAHSSSRFVIFLKLLYYIRVKNIIDRFYLNFILFFFFIYAGAK